MRKMKKWLSLILSVVCACCLFAACGEASSDNSGKPDDSGNPSANVELAFKDDMISSVVVNTEVDLAPYVTYTEGYSAKLAATYVKDGETKSYDTYGLTFTATEVADVTVTVSLKDTNKSISKVLTVTVPAPVISEKRDAVAYVNEETTLADLAEFVEFTSQAASPSVFKVLSVAQGEDVVDLSNETVYTFTKLGTYTLNFEISNAGGKVEDSVTLKVVRNLPANEIADASNWMTSWAPASVPQKDETLHAEDSSWSYKVYASKDSVAGTAGYWSNFAIVTFDEQVDLTKQYVTLDLYASADARPLVLIDFFAGIEDFSRNTPQQEIALTAEKWTHFSTADVTKLVAEGGFGMMRILIMQKEDGTASENCFVAIDNVTVEDYQGYAYEKIDGEWKKLHDYYLALNNWYLNDRCKKEVVWFGAYGNDAPLNADLTTYGLTYNGFYVELNGTPLTSATMHAYAGANWFWVIEFQGTYTSEEGRTGTEIKDGDRITIKNGTMFTDNLGITYRFAGMKVFSDDKNTQLVTEAEDFNLWFVNGAWTYIDPATQA